MAENINIREIAVSGHLLQDCQYVLKINYWTGLRSDV